MKTAELRILCEGDTERNFVTQVLGPHLKGHRVFARAQTISSSGGVIPWKVLRRSIKNEVGRLRAHQCVTTMIDLYALPDDYPGWANSGNESGAERARRIQVGIAQDLPSPNLIPYIQVHEFEALVLLDVDQIPGQFPDGDANSAPERLRKSIGEERPEDIDDGAETAPSKRIIREVPAYAAMKAIAGPAITGAIGIAALRSACPHFGRWVASLEQLASS